MSAARVVLDRFALLTFLRGEAGEENVANLLERALAHEHWMDAGFPTFLSSVVNP
jgi:hypothetical protein